MGQMILSERSIIIMWTYQDMMEWMSRMLVGEMAVANEDFGSLQTRNTHMGSDMT
jgi:hypothetical protein